MVKLDKSQRELRVNRNLLKLKTDHDKDFQKLMQLNQKNGSHGNNKNKAIT